MRDGRTLKAVIPGGSSVPILLPDQLDTQASFDGVQKAGSLLGSAGLIVLDDTVCMVWLAMNLLHFYRHESCGKCTPCREGTDWLYKLLAKVESGQGQLKDLDLLSSIASNIGGKTLCAFGDAAVTPVLTTLKHFRHEYEAHIREGRCTLPADWRAAPARGGALTPFARGATRADAFRLRGAAAPRHGMGRAQAGGASPAARRADLVGPKGLLQPLADIIKLMFKGGAAPETLRGQTHRCFALAPIISWPTAAFAALRGCRFSTDTSVRVVGPADCGPVADVNVAVPGPLRDCVR